MSQEIKTTDQAFIALEAHAKLLEMGSAPDTAAEIRAAVDVIRDGLVQFFTLTRERDEARAALDEAGALHLDTLADRVRDIAGDIDIIAKQRDTLRTDNARLRGALSGAAGAARGAAFRLEQTIKLRDKIDDAWDEIADVARELREDAETATVALAGEGEEALPPHPGDGSCLRCSRVPVTERGFCNTCEEESAGWTPPRRIRADLWTPAEHAIANAVAAVEAAGAHPALTDAVVLLGQARERVADFVDAQMQSEKASPPDPCGHTGLCVRPKGHDGDHANHRWAPDLSTAECRDPHPSNPDIACTRPAGHAGTHQVDGYDVWWPATPEKAREA